VPAAAVIPAPIAYVKVAAVKTLVVERWARRGGRPLRRHALPARLAPLPGRRRGARLRTRAAQRGRDGYLEKIRVFNAGGHAGIIALGITE
jgi:hypothetical protein